MKRFLLPVLAVGVLALAAGCATKNYVKKQAAPLENKIDELDDQTAQTTRGIHDRISARSRESRAWTQRPARLTRRRWPQVSRPTRRSNWPPTPTAACRPHQPGRQSRQLSSGHAKPPYTLASTRRCSPRKDKEQLDELGQQIPNVKGYIVQIEGRTDSVGTPITTMSSASGGPQPLRSTWLPSTTCPRTKYSLLAWAKTLRWIRTPPPGPR